MCRSKGLSVGLFGLHAVASGWVRTDVRLSNVFTVTEPQASITNPVMVVGFAWIMMAGSGRWGLCYAGDC